MAPSTSNNSSKPRAAVTNSATWAPSATKSLLHLQVERETYIVTAAKGLDMLCMIVNNKNILERGSRVDRKI
jgi:hypothetical protein